MSEALAAELSLETGSDKELAKDSEDLSRKKSELLERLQRLSDRVRVFDEKAMLYIDQTSPPSAKEEIIDSIAPSPVPKMFREALISTPTPPLEMCSPEKLNSGGIRGQEINRVVQTIQGVLADQRFVSDDYRRSIAQLNELQNRSKMICSRIDGAVEQLHRKYGLNGREQRIPHLMDQLAVCFRNRPTVQRTLSELREQYDIVVSPYL